MYVYDVSSCMYMSLHMCEHESQGILYMGIVEVRGSHQVALIALSILLRHMWVWLSLAV